MCFTRTKFISLSTVVCGTVGYGIATQKRNTSNCEVEYLGLASKDPRKRLDETAVYELVGSQDPCLEVEFASNYDTIP